MSDHRRIVTIDGPSGGGKSTVSRALAAKLGFTYLDTGAMYRAIAYKCRQLEVDITATTQLLKVLAETTIRLVPAVGAEEDVGVVLDGQEVGPFLRSPEMGMLASSVSALEPVRTRLTEMQRELGRSGKIVAEGRDTGTVVFPDAAWKFYLDASARVRAQRRVAQLRARGEAVDEGQLLEQIIRRDRDDRERTIAPLIIPPEALVIDTTAMAIAEIIDVMLNRVLGTPCC